MKHNDNNDCEKLLEQIIDDVHHSSIILNGIRKVRETVLFPQLEKRLSKSFIFVYVDLENTESEEEFFKKIMSRVVDVCRSHLDVSELQSAAFKTEHYSIEFKMKLGEIIRKLNGQAYLLLLLDGVDTTNIYIQKALQRLRGILQDFSQLRLIMAGVIVYENPVMVSSPWYNVFFNINVTPFTEENVKSFKELVQKFVANILHRNKGVKQPW